MALSFIGTGLFRPPGAPGGSDPGDLPGVTSVDQALSPTSVKILSYAPSAEAVDWEGREGDVLPRLVFQLVDGAGKFLDLTDATVRLLVASVGGRTKVDGACAIEDATVGIGSYGWQPADVDTPGHWYARVDATFPGGARLSFPDDSDLLFVIYPASD